MWVSKMDPWTCAFLAGIEHKGGNSLFFCCLLEIVADGHKYLAVSVVKQINFQMPIDTKH